MGGVAGHRVGKLFFMSGTLVGVENGQVVFGDAVSRLAEVLNPLGAVAGLVAQSCACITEMRRLNLEGRKIDADKTERLVGLENRRVAVGSALRGMHKEVGHAELSAQSLRRSIDTMQRALVNPRVPITEKRLLVETLRFFTAELVNQHSVSGDGLVRAIDTVLNGSGAAASPRASIGAAPRNAAPRRPQAPRRRR